MTNARAVLFTTLVLAVGSARAGAQTIAWRAVVTRAADSRPLVDANVRIPELHRVGMTDTAGTVTFADVPVGRWLVEIRRVGYARLDTVVEVADAGSHTSTFALNAAPRMLDTMAVAAPSPDAVPTSATLPEFEARRAKGTGRYITREQLRSQDERSFTDVLVSQVPGLLLERGYSGVHAYNPSQQPPGALRGNAGKKCYVQIVVDGIAMYHMSNGAPVNGSPPDLTEYLTRALDGVEYYSGPSRTPSELRNEGAMCGTLVLWSRRRGERDAEYAYPAYPAFPV
jgi:hypothetical protein